MYHVYSVPREKANPCVKPESTPDRKEAYRKARELAKKDCIIRVFYENPESGLWELVAPEVWSLEEGENGTAV